MDPLDVSDNHLIREFVRPTPHVFLIIPCPELGDRFVKNSSCQTLKLREHLGVAT